METVKTIKCNLGGKGFFVLLLIGLTGCHPKKDPRQIATKLLPVPQEVTTKDGVSLQPQNIKTIYLYAKAGKKDRFAAHLLQAKIDSLFSRK